MRSRSNNGRRANCRGNNNRSSRSSRSDRSDRSGRNGRNRSSKSRRRNRNNGVQTTELEEATRTIDFEGGMEGEDEIGRKNLLIWPSRRAVEAGFGVLVGVSEVVEVDGVVVSSGRSRWSSGSR